MNDELIKRRTVFVGSSILISLVFFLYAPEPGHAQRPDCGKDCISQVREILKARYDGFSVSWLDKANSRLGDKVGVAIPRIYRGRALYKPDNIRTFLPVIQQAFKYPELIDNQANKSPTVTVRLLLKLQRRISDHFLHREITATLNVVRFSSAKVEPFTGTEKPR